MGASRSVLSRLIEGITRRAGRIIWCTKEKESTLIGEVARYVRFKQDSFDASRYWSTGRLVGRPSPSKLVSFLISHARVTQLVRWSRQVSTNPPDIVPNRERAQTYCHELPYAECTSRRLYRIGSAGA